MGKLDIASSDEFGPDQSQPGNDLDTQLERLGSLRSAWDVLTLSDLAEEGLEIAETAAAIARQLEMIAQEASDIDQSILQAIDKHLDDFEASLREAVTRVPVHQMRAALPLLTGDDRRGILDLLDVLLGGDLDDSKALAERIDAIDYLITLRCCSDATSNAVVQHDPITLTPRLRAICDRVDLADSEHLVNVEREFYAASNMLSKDLREEIRQRALRTRKSELGVSYFAPGILRAVVTYNAALLNCGADDILDSEDCESVAEEPIPERHEIESDEAVVDSEDCEGVAEEPVPEEHEIESDEAVFNSESLVVIAAAASLVATAAAAGMRARGERFDDNPADRIAWALDYAYLAPGELKALSEPATHMSENILGSAILVGLIWRSLEQLEGDLILMGITPQDVSDIWVPELNGIFKREIASHLDNDPVRTVADALIALKDKFLVAPLAPELRKVERPKPLPGRNKAYGLDRRRDKPENARDLVRDALAGNLSAVPRKMATASTTTWRGMYGARLIQLGVLAIALAIAGFLAMQPKGDMSRWSRDQLESVSHHLASGSRDDAGKGRAFVGTIDDDWLDLSFEKRTDAAVSLVMKLRELGVRQIMIYDGDDQLQIQAVGSQPIRTSRR
jgi:hypothetical protein